MQERPLIAVSSGWVSVGDLLDQGKCGETPRGRAGGKRGGSKRKQRQQRKVSSAEKAAGTHRLEARREGELARRLMRPQRRRMG